MIADDETTEIPRVHPPGKVEKEPMPAEYRAWLYGGVAAILTFGAVVLGCAKLITHSDEVNDQEKSHQVQACGEIREPNAAFLCVEQIDD